MSRVNVTRVLIALVLLFAIVPTVRAWRPEGHSIVAEIAQRRLIPAAVAQVRQILGENASLASAGSWADDYRAVHPQTARWHFVDIPVSAQDYDEGRDCASSPEGDCVIHAIARNLEALTRPGASNEQRRAALKFLVHFVGDVNQPLHTVGDLHGYNDLAVCYFSSPAKNDCLPTNLHAVWDVGLIRSIFWDWGGYVDFLEADWIPLYDAGGLAAGTPVEWALEAHQAARDVVVRDVEADAHLGADYLAAVRPTLDRQLAVAGLRLARLLNEALDPGFR
ncbi:MAG TPA: S1/P1 nuclease [Roseiarcus sp.]|nr:S1/P1 nuclease [Roseiarcus sp.]